MNSFDYMNAARVKAFADWLNAQGADVLSPTSEYELIRFDCAHGVGVLYTGRRGQRVNKPFVGDAIVCFQKSRKWDGGAERIKNAPGKRGQLIIRDGPFCFYCGDKFERRDLTKEHLLSRNRGGPDTLANLVLACAPCNQAVGHLPLPDKVRWRDERRGEKA